VIYFDSSALVKLVREEPETSALQRWIADRGAKPTCGALARVEVPRAVRAGGDEAVERAAEILGEVQLIPLTHGLLDSAGRMAAPLRSLDAIHLAAALTLRDDLQAFVAYDKPLLCAAEQAGLPVASPGTP